LIDEVLAVGDSAFQQKCFDYFDQLKREKRTIVFISHDMSAVKRYCDRCIVIDKGRIIVDGTPEKAAKLYEKLNLDKIADNAGEKERKKIIQAPVKIAVHNSESKITNKFDYLDTIDIRLSWKNEGVENAGITLFKGNEYVYGTNTFKNDIDVNGKTVNLSIKLNLGPGKYRIGAGLFGDTESEPIVYVPDGPEFVVEGDGFGEWGGITQLKSSWNQKK
jgi:ABC-type glutathione transport system ATPase component